MTDTIATQARYSGGILKPHQPLPFAEGQELNLIDSGESRSATSPAAILASIARLPTAGGDPNSGDEQDRNLYGGDAARL